MVAVLLLCLKNDYTFFLAFLLSGLSMMVHHVVGKSRFHGRDSEPCWPSEL